ncbi:MAG: type III-B CRISPR module RAMP protein Cmr6 [Candidatus Sericytochromatia bacterium]|nr:type III-B CRISPR module RAMP protein Cmr6 [Candidatus Sericytochromatia bacterium]
MTDVSPSLSNAHAEDTTPEAAASTHLTDSSPETSTPPPVEALNATEAIAPAAEALEPESAPPAAPAVDTAPAASTLSAAEAPDADSAEAPAETTPVKETARKKQGERKSRKPATERTQRSIGFIALPVEISQLAKKYGVNHPGLVMGKYAVLLRMQDKQLQYAFTLEQKKRILQKVAHLMSHDKALQNVWQSQKAERDAVLQSSQARQVALSSQSPVVFATEHPLSALGLDLHPLFGFPQIQAQDIKGALRQFAETHWLPMQADASAASQTLQQIFGSASQEGEVVFHDAWPAQWPALSVEQMTNHHPAYYQNQEAPGDWQTPEAACFLSLKPGARFDFAFSARRPDHSALLDQVENWLHEALASEGLGAYRQLGYGRWKTRHTPAPAQWEGEVHLVSPAFMAGSGQGPEDCRLRPGMLKGLLRWWWRTLHAGFLSPRELSSLESAIFGSSKHKGGLQLQLESNEQTQARRYRPEDLLHQLPSAEARRRSPGLVYLGYGFFSENAKRYYVGPEVSWKLSFQAQDVTWQHKGQAISLSAEQILISAQSALWLLCHYGGLGQRKRKGFGSLQLNTELPLSEDGCLEAAARLRQHCGLRQSFEDERAQSAALMQRIELADMHTPWKNPWFVLHQLGESLQTFMQEHKHQVEKKALGLPRAMTPPLNGSFEAAAPVEDRHAAPYCLHLARHRDGALSVRFVGFPASRLPDFAESQRLLSALAQHLRTDIAARVSAQPEEPVLDLSSPATAEGEGRRERRERRPRPQGEGESNTQRERRPRREKPAGGGKFAPRPAGERPERRPRRPEREPLPEPTHWTERPGRRPRTESGPGRNRQLAGLPQAGEWYEVTLLEERTKKDGWRATESKSGLSGPVVNTSMVPGDAEPGQKVQMIVHAVNKLEMMFRWPTDKEREAREKAASGAAGKGRRK